MNFFVRKCMENFDRFLISCLVPEVLLFKEPKNDTQNCFTAKNNNSQNCDVINLHVEGKYSRSW